MKVAYVFPGQGAQWVGMGRDLYDNFEDAKAVFEVADRVLGFQLSHMCFEGPEEELRQTINTQPAIVTVSLACLGVLRGAGDSSSLPSPAFVAGHSLGEYTALAAAGVVNFETAIYLARERGRLMHEAGLMRSGTMAAVIGLEESVLRAICNETDTYIANINCPGQLVVSGASENVTKAADMAKTRGAYKIMPLAVSGAFHTPLMQPAVDEMAEILGGLDFEEPAIPIIANTTAQPLRTAAAIKEELLRQLSNGIDWQHSVEHLLSAGVSRFYEIGPGKVLSGLIRRIDKNAETVNIGDAETISALIAQS